MRYTSKAVRRYTPHQARARSQQIEQARQQIPVNTYLRMLHIAACTGDMPHVDPVTGNMIGTSDHIEPQKRLDVIEYLLDKAVPDLQRVTPEPDDLPNETDIASLTATDVSTMSSEALRTLIVTAERIKDAATTTPQPEPARADGGASPP